jgi:hypothetical protein
MPVKRARDIIKALRINQVEILPKILNIRIEISQGRTRCQTVDRKSILHPTGPSPHGLP